MDSLVTELRVFARKVQLAMSEVYGLKIHLGALEILHDFDWSENQLIEALGSDPFIRNSSLEGNLDEYMV